MPVICTLPQERLDQISGTVSSVFKWTIETLDSLGTPVNDHEVAAAVAERILQCAKDALAGELARHNSVLSPQNLLPDELWCSVWEHLPFFDCVSTSHVCSRWRRASLACPLLWTDVTCYTTVHNGDCHCYSCDPDYDICCRLWDVHDDISEDGTPRDDSLPHGRHRLPVGWTRSPYHPNRTNAASLENVLDRSAQLPLSIVVHIVPYESCAHSLRLLAHALDPHAARVRQLRVLSADSNAPQLLLNYFGELPGLLSAAFESLPNAEEDFWSRDIAFDRSFAAPQLQSIELCQGFAWPSKVAGLDLLTVKTLSIAPTKPRELLSALRSCRGVRNLRLDLRQFSNLPLFHKLAKSIPPIGPLSSLSVVGKYFSHIGDTDLLNTGDISFQTGNAYPGYHDRLPELSIFTALSAEKKISLARRDRLLILRGGDAFERRRRVVVTIWQSFEHYAPCLIGRPELECRSAGELCIEASLWPVFVAGVPFSPSLPGLEIVLGGAIDCVADDPAAPLPGIRRTDICFPSLRTLHIARARQAVGITARDLVDLVLRLGLRLPFKTLTVDKQLLTDGPEPLYDLAEVVILDIRHVDLEPPREDY